MQADIQATSLLNQQSHFNFVLKKSKLDFVNHKKGMLVEKIKNVIIELVYYSDEQIKTNFSDYLSEKLNYHYTYLSNLFSKIHGSTIENFIIVQKIERAKELLIYDKLNLTEVAFKLHYSSVPHLSNQFKKVTGLTPSYFQALSFTKYDGMGKYVNKLAHF